MMLIRTQPKNTVPPREYFKIAVTYIGAMLASNVALNYVSYPTQVLAKSCKLIPVMIMRIVVLGKSYSRREYAAVALITVGISVFMLCKPPSATAFAKAESGNSMVGLLLLIVSLVLDGYTSPSQEKLLTTHRPSIDQMMLGLNACAVGLLVLGIACEGEFYPGLEFVTRFPEVITEVLWFCLAFTLGQYLLLQALFRFNSLVLVTITTTRKFFSILFSVFLFGHAVGFLQWIGVSMVFSGLVVDMFNKDDAKAAPPDETTRHARFKNLIFTLVALQGVVVLLWLSGPSVNSEAALGGGFAAMTEVPADLMTDLEATQSPLHAN